MKESAKARRARIAAWEESVRVNAEREGRELYAEEWHANAERVWGYAAEIYNAEKRIVASGGILTNEEIDLLRKAQNLIYDRAAVLKDFANTLPWAPKVA